ncbi:MAG: DMT family transporter, partial [Rhodospirillaceae bacterium]
VLLAAIALQALIRLTGIAEPPPKGSWKEFLPLALISNALPFSLIVWGQTHIDSGLASILNAMTPLNTVLVAHLLTSDEKITPGKALGLALGLFGVVVMIGPEALGGLGDQVLGQLAVLGATVSYGFAIVRGRRIKAMGIAPVTAAAGMLTWATVLLLPVALVVEQPWTLQSLHWQTPLALLGLSLLSTAAAYLLYFRILAGAGATNMALVTFLVPITANLLGIVFLGEEPGWDQLFGILAIGTGLAFIDGRLPQKLFGRGKPNQAEK